MANISVSVTDANNITVQLTPVAAQTITIDRGVTGATGATGPGVAAGGTTGQVLSKASNTNYDTAWTTITGTLNYQGAWNASTNTPTLVSSVGTNGYYYVVSVAGSTSLNGITDWQIGDWAIFNGTIWQKIDQTNLVTSVNGQTGAVSVGTVTSVTGTAPISSSGGTTPAISIAAATASVNGYLTSTDWTTFNNKGSGTVTSVSATSPVTSSGGATPNIAMPAATTSVSGYLTNTDWTTFNNKGSGTVTSVAALTLGTTGTDLSSTVANGTTTPVITLNVPTASATNRGALSSTDWTTFNNKGSGTITSVTGTAPIVSSGGTTPAISMAAASALVNGYLTNTDWTTFNNKSNTNGTVTSVAATAGTGISITGSPITTSGTLNIINTAPDQIVALTQGGTTTITGTYPNFNISSADQYQGTVTSVTATSPVASTGGTTPIISMPAATTTVSGYLTSTDWTTFNNKGSGTVTSVTATSPVASTGGVTPVISIPAATAAINGYLTSTDWSTFNSKGSGSVTSVSASVPTGLSISGSPITTSGTLAITYTAGYAIPTTASQTNWDTAYTERLQWNGGSTGLVAATGRTSLGLVIGTDVLAPNGSAAALTSFPTFNQNTTGTAANVTGIVAIANGGTGATTLASASIATYTGTETLTNKRIDPRVTSSASASSLTPSVATADVYAYTALAAGLTINAPIGTPVDGDKMMFRLLDNGTPQTLTWNATFTVIGVTLPTTTTASKTTYVGCIYNSNATRWDVIAVTTQA